VVEAGPDRFEGLSGPSSQEGVVSHSSDRCRATRGGGLGSIASLQRSGGGWAGQVSWPISKPPASRSGSRARRQGPRPRSHGFRRASEGLCFALQPLRLRSPSAFHGELQHDCGWAGGIALQGGGCRRRVRRRKVVEGCSAMPVVPSRRVRRRAAERARGGHVGGAPRGTISAVGDREWRYHRAAARRRSIGPHRNEHLGVGEHRVIRQAKRVAPSRLDSLLIYCL